MAGIYIHIPFCRKACNYCNFHFSTSFATKQKFIKALLQEIKSQQLFITPVPIIETIYFGGGTPSVLAIDELNEIISAVKDSFEVSANAEITLEANPDDINPQILEAWLAIGINRLSVGLQSLNDNELSWMNRAHNATQSLEAMVQIKAAGFSNFSVDLIFGSPLQTMDILEHNLKTIFSLKVPHISCYALTVEPKTALHHNILFKKGNDIDTDVQAAQYDFIVQKCIEAGYEQYEISSFALPECRSRHNSSYWEVKPYYGFGPSAHGFNGVNVRRWNVANNALYIAGINAGNLVHEQEELTKTQILNEYIMLALRTTDGIQINKLKEDFGDDAAAAIIKTCLPYIETNRITVTDNTIALTASGKFLADGIAAALFQ